MSCPNATAPIDITLSNIEGNCDLKCSYSFQYNNSSCNVTNRKSYLSIKYEASSSSNYPVKYNSKDYNVEEIRIYTPSLHSYNGNKTDGEMIITHISPLGNNPLLVCIPIVKNNSSTSGSILLDTILSTTASKAPSDGESVNVNISNFNINMFVPKKPYFSYSATIPYQPCSQQVEYIVFLPEHGCPLSSNSFTTLKNIISANTYTVKNGVPYFYNANGPNSNTGSYNGNNDIYIDCQPVGQSEETTTVVTNTNVEPIDINSIVNSPFFQIIVGILCAILVIVLFSYVIGHLPRNPIKVGGSTFYSHKT